nr:MAG TPA: hypothetical protein [Caudoviricetes sp.]
MAEAILMSGGVGGVASDDVTAKREHVLQGYTALTSDSDDEVVQGTMVNRGNGMDTVEFADAYWDSKYIARVEQGFYAQVDQWKPYVGIPYAVFASGIHIDANKMLDTLQVAGVRGNIHTYGAWNNASEVVNATWENKVHVRFEEGYYPKDRNYKPAAIVTYDALANAIGLDVSKMLSSLGILGKQGQIKTVDTAESNYRINKSTAFGIDGWTNPSNPVFYVDFPHGSAYYTRPDGHPHVCIDAVNLGDVTPDKVMRGFTATSKNGVRFAGTMPDYSSGRVVFNGATFDNVLVSGVAAKGFYANGTYYAYNIQSGYAYGGIYGGGMNLQLNTTYHSLRSRRIGCVFSQSINVTPFRQIVIYYRSVANIQGNPYVSLEAHVSRASIRGHANVAGTDVDTIDVIRQGTASPAINREGQIVLDVSAINEHIFLSFGAFCNQDRASDIFAGAVQITRVDFLN